MQKVVLFHHSMSKYGVLGQMVQDMKKAFDRLGIQATIEDVQNKGPDELRDRLRAENPDCTWSLNTFVDEHWFYYPLGIPHVDLSVDSVTYSSPAVFSQPSTVSLFVDKTSCDLFSAYSSNPVHWFPHAISKETIDSMRSAPIVPLRNRPYDVSLIGSFIDHRRVKAAWDPLFATKDVEMFVSLAEQALEDPSFTLLAEALAYIEGTPTVLEVLEKSQLSSFSLASLVERYARGLDRERLLMALQKRTVHIFTETEDAVLWSKESAAQRCLFNPPVPFSQVGDVCRLSKVVVNSIPHIRKGFHERIFLSLAAGAITLVRKGISLPGWLLRTGRVVEYSSNALDDLIPRLEVAEKQHYDPEKILPWLEAEHSWDARLEHHLPDIETSIEKLRSMWEQNRFWRMLNE